MSLDLCESLRMFVKVAELGSFTRAADHFGVGKARVSLALRALEAELGAPLLTRSTRVVRVTPEGEELLPRARQLVLEADEVGALFRAHRGLRGRVRIDLPATLAREVVIPRVPELLARHPDLELVLSSTDRRLEPREEGFDCVLRVGALGDSQLVSRRLGLLVLINCASPAYLRKHGVPQRLEDLERHFVVHYSSTLSGERPAFEYREGDRYAELPMRSRITVNNTDAYRAACIAGLGIIQAPRQSLGPALAEGSLVEILPELPCAPMPVSLLHTHGRNPPRRVRAVLAWLAECATLHLAAESATSLR
jgi:DNA-binding transcriptional LysR family regulator